MEKKYNAALAELQLISDHMQHIINAATAVGKYKVYLAQD